MPSGTPTQALSTSSAAREQSPHGEAAHDPAQKGSHIPTKAAESWWTRHGELACAIVSGLLLVAAAMEGWNRSHDAVYWILVAVAFGLGFIFGSLEAWQSLRKGQLDIHFLMIAGAVAAIFVGSAFEGAVLLFLFTLSGALEQYAMQRTHAALESLIRLFPKEAIVLSPDGTQSIVKLEELRIGDRLLIKPGENVAADGVVLEGVSAVDESAITGEYLPREKMPGAAVHAGTLNTSGRLVMRVEKAARDTTLANIIHLVSEAREEKAPVERLFDRIGTPYTLGVLALALATILVLHFWMGAPWVAGSMGAIYRGITLLIVASPCALIISTPVVLLSAIATCARRGIVLKGGRHLESLAALQCLVFDKTGTLTSGQVKLVAIEPIQTHQARRDFATMSVETDGSHAEQRCATAAAVAEMPKTDVNRQMLMVAASLEANSTHPLASAVMRAAQAAGATPEPVEDFVQEPGHGIRGMVNGQPALLGSPQLLEGFCHTRSMELLISRIAEAERVGQTAVVMYYGGRAGLLRFQDTVRPEAAATVQRLHALGVRPLVMLTGDNAGAAKGIATELGLDEVHAELLPHEKLREMERLVAEHRYVGMVGDGVNDAPALARATVGIAMGSIGSDAALEAADVVLLSDRIERLPWLIETSRRARRVMAQNLVFSIGVIVLLVAATLTVGVPLSLGVVGHEGSTLLVVLNGLRLLRGGKFSLENQA